MILDSGLLFLGHPVYDLLKNFFLFIVVKKCKSVIIWPSSDIANLWVQVFRHDLLS